MLACSRKREHAPIRFRLTDDSSVTSSDADSSVSSQVPEFLDGFTLRLQDRVIDRSQGAMLHAILMLVAAFQTEACSRQIYLLPTRRVSMLLRICYVFPKWREHGTLRRVSMLLRIRYVFPKWREHGTLRRVSLLWCNLYVFPKWREHGTNRSDAGASRTSANLPHCDSLLRQL